MGAEQVDVCKVLAAIFFFYFGGMWLFALWVGFTHHKDEEDADDAFVIMVWPFSILVFSCVLVGEWMEKMEMKKSRIYMVLKGFLLALTIPFRPFYIGHKMGMYFAKRKEARRRKLDS